MADPLSIASGVAGLLSLGLQTTEALVKFYTSHKGRNDNIARTSQRLETLQSAFDALQTTLQQRKFQPNEETLIRRIESSIHSCAELIQELQEECTKLTGPLLDSFNDAFKVAGRRAAYPFRESTLKKLEEDAGEMRNHLSLALDILQLRDHKTAQDELAEMKSLVELMRATQISSAVQDWIKAPDVSVNHNAACAKRHPGTGTWFVKDPVFHNWINQTNSFLWLYGFAGCGKSVLCSTAIQYTFRQRGAGPNIGIAFFYFTFNDESKRDESAMLRALLLQLAGQLPDGDYRLDRMRNSYKSGQLPPPAVLIQYLRNLIQLFHQVYILIDALDESPRGTRRDEILVSIMAMRGWSLPGLHLLVTSRDEPDIRESLEITPDEKVAMNNDDVEQDISKFIAEKLANDSKLRIKWQAHRDQIQETLAKRANGVFRWVECQFQALKHCPKSERHLERCLQSLPRSLDETYERMLLNIDDPSYEEARRILTVLCFSSRPMKVSELLHGIAIDLNEPAHLDRKSLLKGIDDLCEICPGLVDFGQKVDDNTTSGSLEVTVRIAHFSVQEYLESDRIRQQMAGFFAMSRISAHQDIATICCAYLLEPELSNADLTPAKLDDFPLAHYAAQFWYHHYQAGKGKTAQLSTLITKIFKLQHDQFATWVKLHDPVDQPWNTKVDFERISDTVAPALYYASFLGLDWIIPEILLAGKTSGCKVEDMVNVQGGHYGNALQAASTEGHVEIARKLIEQGAKVNIQGGYYGNALQAASAKGLVEIASILIEQGAEVNVQGGYYGNALQAASAEGHVEIASILIEQGAEVNIQGGCYGDALRAASEKGHIEIVEMLLDHGAEVNHEIEDGSALYAASEQGHRKIVVLLVVAGADVNGESGQHGYALQAASAEGHQDIVEMLIEKGADINAQNGYYNYPPGEGWCECDECCIGTDDEYNTALQAASARGHQEVVEMLIEKGANVHIQGGSDGNALQAATKYGHQEIVKLLIEKGADIHALCGYSSYALQTAARHGHREIVELLIEKGAEVNALAGESGHALEAAIRGGHQEIVKLLIEKGAEVNALGGNSSYALEEAIRGGRREIVKLLIEEGADVNAQCGRYGNALQFASASGHVEIIEMLVKKGAVSLSGEI